MALLLVVLMLMLLAALIFIYAKVTYSYWENRNLSTYPGACLPFGNLTNILNTSLGVQFHHFYDYFKQKGLQHGGVYLFQTPVYMPCDPELCKRIMTKDYGYFEAKGVYSNDRDQPVNAHLFNLGGQRWKNLRVKLTPTFTSGKIKCMFPLIVDHSVSMLDKVDELATAGMSFNIKDICARYSTDVIGSCAFGLSCNSFRDTNSEFRHYGKWLVDLDPWYRFQLPLTAAYPKLSKFLHLVNFPPKCAEFFSKITRDMVAHREQNATTRTDFLQLMIEMKNKALISMEEIISQSFLIFIAGFETSSSAMAHCVMELCFNLEIQEKVRDEVQKVLMQHNEELSYECVGDMKYLEQCIQETLRKYPALPVINRECTKTYKVPNSNVVLEEGTKVYISLLGLHMDPEFFPDPEQFDPDRFTDANKELRHPYTWIPFGEGPRICIGMRFGVLQTKIALIQLLTHYRFEFAKPMKSPVEFNNVLVVQTKEDIIVNAYKL